MRRRYQLRKWERRAATIQRKLADLLFEVGNAVDDEDLYTAISTAHMEMDEVAGAFKDALQTK